MDSSRDLYPQPEAAHAYNNMGLIRIVLALLVIVSHSFELVGGRTQELLVRIFGTMTFGEVAVDGFFLLSGYLISKSYMHSRSIASYLRRRVLRVYPGYIVAYCLSLLIVVPLSGAPVDLSFAMVLKQAIRMVILAPPEVEGAFRGLPVPEINLSMWTISYEFRCYVLVLLVGVLGLFRKRLALALLVGVLGAMLIAGLKLSLEYHVEEIVGKPTNLIRLCFIFFSGSLFYIFEEKLVYSLPSLILAALLLLICMFIPSVAEPGFTILGGYLLFWIAFRCKVTPYSRFDSHVDLSYGVYLYAFPIQNVLIYLDRSISSWTVLLVSVPIAILFASASWSLVERPFMQMKQRVAV